jgi:hypothetical protein
MNDWFHALPIVWMALLIFGVTYLIAAAIFALVMIVATGDRTKSFKAISHGILPPLGILFGLFVAFTAVQVWNDNDAAIAAIDREASALRTALILSAIFPGDTQARLRELVSSHVQDVAQVEWPSMAHQTATLGIVPHHLADALDLGLALTPASEGQRIAQREMTIALESALDARRQRILLSRSQVGLIKWACLFVQAICILFAIALVHCDNPLGSIIVLGIFATGTAACILLIASYDRPFIGQLAVTPEPLLQVMPEAQTREGVAR